LACFGWADAGMGWLMAFTVSLVGKTIGLPRAEGVSRVGSRHRTRLAGTPSSIPNG
jgi:hypothetical protein